MTRSVKQPEVRKKELIEIALKQFLTNGYQKTSIRSILKEAKGEIGMFYHYFESKEEIYREAIHLFNRYYVHSLEKILNQKDQKLEEKMAAIFQAIPSSINDYQKMDASRLNDDMLITIHRETLLAAVPIFEQALIEESKQTHVHITTIDARFLAEFILFGASSVIHDPIEADNNKKVEQIMKMIHKLFRK